MYEIRFARDVAKDLARLTAYHRRMVLAAIEVQLSAQPTVPTRNRKLLVNMLPRWGPGSRIWELRVGEYRIFYDVDEDERTLYVRAIRLKPPDKTTEEIL